MNATVRPTFRRHVPGLDGLRGLAVALVVVYHFVAGWPYWASVASTLAGHLLRVGWVGVDVFFVLSGYLITGILVDARASSHRWKNFMARRALRIFPAYYAMLVVNFALVPWLETHANHPGLLTRNGLAGSWPWFVAYLSNVRQLSPPAYPMALSVTWSLGVEEQFYLLWPWLIWFVPTDRLRNWMIGSIVVGELAKLIWFATTHNEPGLRYLTPCCVDEFGWGALVAVLLREEVFAARLWETLRTLGLRIALPVACVVVLLNARIHPLIETTLLSASVGWAVAALIMTTLAPRAKSFRAVTEARPLRWIGKYSYGIYLTHALFVPYLGIAGHGVRALTLATVGRHALAFLVYLAITLAAALGLYAAVERPMLALKVKFQ